MPHVWWHVCATVGAPTGAEIPLKVPEGQRGNFMALLRFDHSVPDDQIPGKRKVLDALMMQMLEVVRQPNESIVFNPMQGQPTPAKDWKP